MFFLSNRFPVLCRPDTRPAGRAGSKRKLRVNLDPAQYYMDIKDGNDCYEKFNLLVRRDPKENNFKAVLETIRSLISTAAIGRAIPQWLQDVFLGYGDPSSANFRYAMCYICQLYCAYHISLYLSQKTSNIKH